ncbi:hypothetical protein RvY_14992 [Ramazzottius varieornatus]|uniref:Uncharacterized protein n=1 Tax=Ramazzottius varieornatus TaxID=947166 RepID=A0A1D1VTA0_RAMVA|nr:hypothetical protein RvY_14992 [Ramazzottius varieornatus]
MATILLTITAVVMIGLIGIIQAQQGAAKTVAEGPSAAASASEPLAAESSSYNRYRSGGSYGGGVDPRYFDRGDTPHFGLAGFPFGYERRYYGQNVVYDNSLAGFPLNYFNYHQDSYGGGGSSYSKPSYGGSSGYAKPQYRSSAAYTAYPAPMEYGAYMGKPSYNYAAGAGSTGSSSAGGNGYYSLQYGY